MSSEPDADTWFSHYGVSDIPRISDPARQLYRQFGLDEAPALALMHPRLWWPWFRTAVLHGHGAGAGGPRWRQLTGVFVIHRGNILAAIRHRNPAVRPDYVGMVQGLGLSG
jgi:hypothetical protein